MLKRVMYSVSIVFLFVLGFWIGNLGTMETRADATFSEYWFQDGSGNWKVRDSDGNVVKSAWLCDDAVASNGKDIWYLLDENGLMISAGLVQDKTGNYYSLETEHNGYYGMLRYKTGTYGGIYLDLESSHSGSFAKVKNTDGVNQLKNRYTLKNFNIDNSNCVYTSDFKKGTTVRREYIKAINLGVNGTDQDARVEAIRNGRKLYQPQVNEGVAADYIYIGAAFGEKGDTKDAITDLVMSREHKGEWNEFNHNGNPGAYTIVRKHDEASGAYTEALCDLNGAVGDKLFLYVSYEKTSKKAPIYEMMIYDAGKVGAQTAIQGVTRYAQDNGWEIVHFENSNDIADLNAGLDDANRMYLLYKKDYSAGR